MNEEDDIVEVKLPLKDYKMLREIIEERQAMNGLRKWISGKVIWLAAGIITLVGAFEALRKLGEYTK
jgi:hypothetical protein